MIIYKYGPIFNCQGLNFFAIMNKKQNIFRIGPK